MLKVRWIKVLRELWSNKARTALVVLSIAVGVFALGTIVNSWIILINDLEAAYMATNPASAILTLASFDNDLVRAVEGRREIAQAEGRRTLVVKLLTAEGERLNLSLDAMEDFSDLAISRVTPEKGTWPPARRQLILERSWEEPLGLSMGDTVQIEMPNGDRFALELAGYAHDLHRPPAGNGAVYGYISLETLRWLGETPTYNQLYLTVADNPLDKEYIGQVVSRVKEQVVERAGYQVLSTRIPTPGQQFLTPIIQAILIVLSVLGVFSLLLSGGLVVNTVSAIIARQVRQIGVLKAIGGRKQQIVEIYLASVVIFGLLSLGIAMPLALIGTRALSIFWAQRFNFDVVTTSVPLSVIALEAAISLLVPVLAALIPIFSGTRITVREAINDYGVGNEGSRDLLDRLATRVRGIPGSFALSLRNTFRRKARLALTVGTLTLAGAIFVAVLSVRNSLFVTFNQALSYTQYDLRIDFGQPARVRQIEREAARVPGIVSIEGWLQQAATRPRDDGAESANYTLIGLPADSTFINPVLIEGRWLRASDRRKVVVNTDFVGEEPDVAPGDLITLTVGGKDDEWEVVGIVSTQFGGPVIYAEYADLGRTLNQMGLANQAVIRLSDTKPASQAQVAQRLEERFKQAGILVGSTTTRSEFVETFEGRFNIMTVFLLVMAFLLAVVGGLGLAGTMGLNVLERVREIGVMRAIGASNRAVQQIILAEGIVIGILSWVLATLVSVPLSKLLSDGVGLAFGGEPLAFSFSMLGVALWLVLAILIAGVSSYLPARQASRMSVREVLSYE